LKLGSKIICRVMFWHHGVAHKDPVWSSGRYG